MVTGRAPELPPGSPGVLHAPWGVAPTQGSGGWGHAGGGGLACVGGRRKVRPGSQGSGGRGRARWLPAGKAHDLGPDSPQMTACSGLGVPWRGRTHFLYSWEDGGKSAPGVSQQGSGRRYPSEALPVPQVRKWRLTPQHPPPACHSPSRLSPPRTEPAFGAAPRVPATTPPAPRGWSGQRAPGLRHLVSSGSSSIKPDSHLGQM